MTIANDFLLEMQRRMLRIRYFDERASKMVKRGEIPGTVHTSIGQEAQVVGATMALGDNDYMTGNHRSHGHHGRLARRQGQRRHRPGRSRPGHPWRGVGRVLA